MTKRPPHTFEDTELPPHVRELLEAGRSFQVPDYDFEQGLAKHLRAVETGAPLPEWAHSMQPAGGAPGATGVAGSTLIGWIVLPIVTAVVVGAVVLSSGSEQAPVSAPPAPGPAPSAAPAAAVAPAANFAPANFAQPAVAAEPVAPAAAQAAVPAASARPASLPVEPAKPAHPVPATKRAPVTDNGKGMADRDADGIGAGLALPLKAHSAASGAPRPARAPAAQQPVAAAEPEPEPEPQATEEEPARAEAPSKPQPAPMDDARLEREMAMLAVAQRVLHTDPERALKLARQGESEFAGSMFTQERQHLLLLALVELSRVDEAKRLARPFLARYPNGPFSDRVRRALATGRVER